MRKSCVNMFIKILGFKIKIHGKIKEITPAVYISNHRCFSDPLLALNYFYFYPIGKAEIEKYPLIGLAAKETGILFVKRENKESRNNVKQGIQKALQANLNIFLCPEGTTNVGQLTKEFKKGAFEVASGLHIPVIPIALVYHQPASDFWLPGDSLVQHFIRQFGKITTKVDIYFPDQPFYSTDPIRLMNDCKNWIDEKLLTIKVPEEVSSMSVYNLKV
jgi:lyso-ornithine lipid O-acyltransferase